MLINTAIEYIINIKIDEILEYNSIDNLKILVSKINILHLKY